ncbi:MAG TPA: hypothetical protein VK986_09095 [Tepidisphaeraceae bacterium]|nr:hypothetical protein [Tepidisphaeraceae bacterium]
MRPTSPAAFVGSSRLGVLRPRPAGPVRPVAPVPLVKTPERRSLEPEERILDRLPTEADSKR